MEPSRSWIRRAARAGQGITAWVLTVAFLLICVGITLWFFFFGRNSLYAGMRGELMAIARTGAAMVDPELVQQIGPGDEQTPAFQTLKRQLDQIRAASPRIRYVYIVQPTDDPTLFRFLVDPDPEDPAAIGEELDASEFPDMVTAIDAPAADREITADRWGQWLSGYAPIRDATGRTVAVLGLDLPASDVARAVGWLALVTLGFGITSVVTAVAAGQWLSGRITLRMRELRSQISALSERVAGPEAGLAATTAPEDTQALVQYYEALVDRVVASRAQLDHLFHQTLAALASAVRTRDTYTSDHSHKVARLTDRVAGRLGSSDSEREHLRYAAILHDVGKIGIPDHILLKPGPLTVEERRVIEKHPRLGFDLLWQVESLRPVAEIVLAHHERWDGRGYPMGLAGADIPLPARIISVVDAYSAITTDRPYQRSRPTREAVKELKRVAGTQLDPVVVTSLIEVLVEDGELMEEATALGA